MSIYGTPALKTESDEIDEMGVRRLVLSLRWCPSRAGLSRREIDLERPLAPEVPGLALQSLSTTPGRGFYQTRWVYKGADREGNAEFPPQTRELSQNYRFEPEWGELPITRHPRWIELRNKYQGKVNSESGLVEWPEKYKLAGIPAYALIAWWDSTLPNPMFGRQAYEHLTGGTYVFEYADERFPPKFWEGIGKVYKTSELPGNPPVFPGDEKRDWIKTTPRYQRAGSLIAFTELYRLSDIGGWPDMIYPVRPAR